jgi:Flp pilus assembly pilin Flp
MNSFTKGLLKLWEDETGQDLVEYALILAFIALVGLATMQAFAASLALFLTGLGNKITSAV